MLVLDGCVQPSMAPDINPATARVLDKLAINLVAIKEAGCCGALSYHLNEQEEGLQFARANIDAWWPHVENGAEAIVMTASGCGVFVKDYAELLKHDSDVANLKIKETAPIAFHPPCTLQHGQKQMGTTEELLKKIGFTLTRVKDAHFCCGSAGTYSILQKELSQKLLERKMDTLKEQKKSPDLKPGLFNCYTSLEVI